MYVSLTCASGYTNVNTLMYKYLIQIPRTFFDGHFTANTDTPVIEKLVSKVLTIRIFFLVFICCQSAVVYCIKDTVVIIIRVARVTYTEPKVENIVSYWKLYDTLSLLHFNLNILPFEDLGIFILWGL